MKGYIWYSAGSDVTGPALAKALGFESGSKTPDFTKFDVVLGWGAKAGTKYNAATMEGLVEQRKLRILNAVEAVDQNRDKAASLTLLQAAGISIPGFLIREGSAAEFTKELLKALKDGKLDFPIVGTTRTNKGTPVFCHTPEDMIEALKGPKAESIEYFRSFCPGTEYRIHVLRDEVLFAQMKVPAKDPKKALADELKQTLKKRLEKKGDPTALHAGTLDWAVDELVPELLQGPAQMLRSLGRGWSLETVKEVPAKASAMAIRALDTLGLDLGAVSVEVDGETARVTTVATAPNLEDSQMKIYVSALRKFCSSKSEAEKKIPDLEADEATPELLATLTRQLKGANKSKLEAISALLKG